MFSQFDKPSFTFLKNKRQNERAVELGSMLEDKVLGCLVASILSLLSVRNLFTHFFQSMFRIISQVGIRPFAFKTLFNIILEFTSWC
jgi:hypothetical protein